MRPSVQFCLLPFVFAAMSICLFTGCDRYPSRGMNANERGKNEKINVVATIFPLYDFTREVTGDKAEITMLLPPASESHYYEPTPQDIISIQHCDVFIFIGGESDAWVDKILGSMDTGMMNIVTLMECVDTVTEEAVEGMQVHDEEGASYDEHIWTSPENAKIIVQRITEALCDADPAHADTYKENAAAFLTGLDELDGMFQSVLDSAARKTIVFGDRFPFRYFADAYGLEYYAAFPGCSAEAEASAATVKFLIDKINAEQIPVIFHIELSNKKMANAISEATGAEVRLLHACQSISKADFEAGQSYISIMKSNVAALREALH